MSNASMLGELLYNNYAPICCLCLNSTVAEDGMNVNDTVYLNPGNCSESTVLMSYMIKCVLHREDFVSNSVCSSCVMSTVSAYKFIQMCAQATDRLTMFVDSVTAVVTEQNDRRLKNSRRIFIATELTNTRFYHDTKLQLPYHRGHSTIQRALTRFQALNSPETLAKYICATCGHVCHKRATLVDHIRKNCHKTPCEICGLLITQRNMRQHKRLCGKDNSKLFRSNAFKYECGKCSKQFRLYKECEIHVQRDICTNTVIQNKVDSKPFKCKVCKAEYISNQALNTHLRIHSDNKNDYQECSWCLKRFPCPGQLKSHAVTHTKEKNWACDICGGTFVTRASLTYHVRTHTGEKPYECDYCDETFLSASRRRDHVLVRHLPKIECKYCHKWFGQRSITGHLQRHCGTAKPRNKLLGKTVKKVVYQVKSLPES